MLFQSCTPFPWLTVKENIRFGLDISGMPKAHQERIAQEFVERVGLKRFERAYPKTLSGGVGLIPVARRRQDPKEGVGAPRGLRAASSLGLSTLPAGVECGGCPGGEGISAGRGVAG